MHTLLRFPLAMLLAVVVFGCAGTSAAPKEITVRIEYRGEGGWLRNATRHLSLQNCHHRMHSEEFSWFNWLVAWDDVTIPLTGGNARASVPDGRLDIEHRASYTDDATGCGGAVTPACRIDSEKTTAPEAEFADLEIKRDRDPDYLTIAVDADASPNDAAGCPTVAGDGNSQHLMYLANYGPGRVRRYASLFEPGHDVQTSSFLSPLQAANVDVRISELLRAGSVSIPVAKEMWNLPPEEFDCSTAAANRREWIASLLHKPYDQTAGKIEGLDCVEDQAWTGSVDVTLVRQR
jgi:hypothetical protein